MKNSHWLTFAPIIVMGLFAANTIAEPKAKSDGTTPITLAELNDRGIEGSLGKPLGTIVEVSGIVVKNDSKAKADVSDRYFVRVESVDGKPLPRAYMFPQRQMSLDDEIAGIKIGDRFTCIGYETGVFAGIPSGAFNHIPSMACVEYHFETHFAVLKAK